MTQFAKDLDDAILTAITSTMLAHPGAPKGLIIGCLIDKLAFVFAAASSDKDYDRKVVLDFVRAQLTAALEYHEGRHRSGALDLSNTKITWLQQGQPS